MHEYLNCNRLVFPNLLQFNYNLTLHGANKVLSTILRSDTEIALENSISAAIPIASAKEPIVAWLREQCLLSESILYKIAPRAECPKDWPLGWKVSLETAIDSLKNPAGP